MKQIKVNSVIPHYINKAILTMTPTKIEYTTDHITNFRQLDDKDDASVGNYCDRMLWQFRLGCNFKGVIFKFILTIE